MNPATPIAIHGPLVVRRTTQPPSDAGFPATITDWVVTSISELRRSDWRSPWMIQVAMAVTALLCCLLSAIPSARVLALAYLLVVPGDLLRRALRVRVRHPAEAVIIAIAASITVQLIVVVLTQLLFTRLGVSHPLRALPLLICEVAVVGALVVAVRRVPLPQKPANLPGRGWLGALLCGPLLTVVGVPFMDNGQGRWLLVVGLIAASSCVLVAWWRRSDHLLGWSILAVSLAVVWSFSLRSTGLYGYDVHQEFEVFQLTLETGRWTPREGDAYSAMLSLTSLPTALVELTRIQPLTLFKVVFPAMLALYPLAMYAQFRRYAGPRVSGAASVLLSLSADGIWEVTAIVRQQQALLIFAAVMLLVIPPTSRGRGRLLLAGLLSLACVVSHYSTAYISVTVLALAGLITWLAPLLRLRRPATPSLHLALPAVMVIACLVWGAGVTQSSGNVTRAASQYMASGGRSLQARAGESLLATWFKGTENRTVTAAELFEDSKQFGLTADWLQPYPNAIHEGFTPEDVATTSSAPTIALSVSDLAYAVLRQSLNIALAASALVLMVGCLRRRVGSTVKEITALAGAALILAAAMRLSTGLSLAYNAERLALQTEYFLGIPLVIVFPVAYAHLRQRFSKLAPSRNRGFRRPVMVAGLLLVALGLFDATGLRSVTGAQAGNLRDGEHYQRFYFQQTDSAAADWLAKVWAPSNMVYSDRYAGLLMAERREFFDGGVLKVFTPYCLDQRAFVFASTENAVSRRTRVSMDGEFASFVYPLEFLEQKKSVVYSNGSGMVFN